MLKTTMYYNGTPQGVIDTDATLAQMQAGNPSFFAHDSMISRGRNRYHVYKGCLVVAGGGDSVAIHAYYPQGYTGWPHPAHAFVDTCTNDEATVQHTIDTLLGQ